MRPSGSSTTTSTAQLGSSPPPDQSDGWESDCCGSCRENDSSIKRGSRAPSRGSSCFDSYGYQDADPQALREASEVRVRELEKEVALLQTLADL